MYFSYYLTVEKTHDFEDTYHKMRPILQFIIYIGILYFFLIELSQIMDKKWKYIGGDMVDLLSLGLNLAIMVDIDFLTKTDIHFTVRKTFVAIAVALLWYKAFYWMSLFTPTAFFIHLLQRTFKDIRAFMVMLIILILCFANIFFIYNVTRGNAYLLKNGTNSTVFSKILNNNFISSIAYTY